MKKIATVCFIQQEDKVLLAHIKYSQNDKKWTGIGGMLDVGEDPDDCVVREISEETELTISKADLKKVREIEFETYKLVVYTTKKWEGKVIAIDPTILDLKWFKKDELPTSQMHDGVIKWLPQVLESSQ